MKAIRDKILADGVEILPPYGTKFLDLLVQKLHEEAREVEFAVRHQRYAKVTAEAIIEELGDVIEVAYALALRYAASAETVDIAREFKLLRKGGFDLGCVIS